MRLLLVLGMCIACTNAFDLIATCDNEMKLYVDGVLQSLPASEADNWKKVSTVSISDSAQVLGIECYDHGVKPGILASGSNGVFTDGSWFCSPVEEAGWAAPGFNTGSGNWQAATTMGRIGDAVAPWGTSGQVSQIADIAKWIWTDRNTWPSNVDTTVYCRKVIDLPNTDKMTATCDNELKVYIDGTQQILSSTEANDWTQTSFLDVNNNVQVVGLECFDLHVKPGILASSANGMLTDGSWWCSPVFEEGWAEPGFATDSGNWQPATTMGRNGDYPSPWGNTGEVSQVDSDAYWIWTDSNSWPDDIDQTVYCRNIEPKEPEPCTCYCRGDPACRPFDGDWRLVPGAGSYRVLDIDDPCDVEVWVTMQGKENPANRMFITSVTVFFGGDTIELLDNGKAKVGGIVSLPYPGAGYTISEDDKWTVVEFDCGITVRFHGKGLSSVMEITAPPGSYDNDGMCGDCNGHVEGYFDSNGDEIDMNDPERYRKAAEAFMVA